MVHIVIALLLLLAAAPARAQSVYVAGSIGADVSRVNHTNSNVYASSSSSGDETISGSLRVGTAVGQNWGVELEFVHSGRSHIETVPGVLPVLASYAVALAPTAAMPASISASSSIAPIAYYQTDVRRTHSDLDGVIWARQRVGGSVDLVYIGGIVFSRERVEVTQNFPTIRLFAPVPNGMFRSTVISYGTRPLAGIEARVRFTSHVSLLPGVRMQGIADGWLIRPYVGLGWFF
jgi:hypothetical protein